MYITFIQDLLFSTYPKFIHKFIHNQCCAISTGINTETRVQIPKVTHLSTLPTTVTTSYS
jgi:hypothetical protein